MVLFRSKFQVCNPELLKITRYFFSLQKIMLNKLHFVTHKFNITDNGEISLVKKNGITRLKFNDS